MLQLPVRTDTLNIRGRYDHSAEGCVLWLLLDGDANCIGDLGQFSMSRSDLLFIEDGRQVTVETGGCMVSQLTIDSEFFHSCMDPLSVSCNSAMGGGSYGQLRLLMSQLSVALIRGGNEGALTVMSKLYGLLDILRGFTAVKALDGSDRRGDMERFIKNNYRNPLTLNDLAKEFYLSPQYLSRYFKRSFGQGFYGYLTALRLTSAVRELNKGGGNITQAAMTGGFPNVSSFVKAFRDKFGVTPKDYISGRKAVKTDVNITGSELTLSHLATYIPFEAEVGESREISVVHDASPTGDMVKSWRKLINLEHAALLLSHEVQAQTAMAKRELGFEFGRIINLLSEEVFPGFSQEGLTVFGNLNKIIDFMLSISLKPFIELQPKIVKSSLGGGDMTFSGRQQDIPDSRWSLLMNQLFAYLSKRWGEDEVRSWRFELWMVHSETLELTKAAERSYIRRFKATRQIMETYIPGGNLGGPGLNLAGASLTSLERVMSMMKDGGLSPSFFSVYLYPHYVGKTTAEKLSLLALAPGTDNQSTEELGMFKRTIAGSGYGDREVLVTEFASDISSRMALSDSCYQAAFLARAFLSLGGMASGLGYWYLSDLSYENKRSDKPIFGGSGLISRDGIRKSGYYAMWLMSKLGGSLIAKGENYVFTCRGSRHFELLVHNCKELCDEFCASGFLLPQLPPDKEIYNDLRSLRLRFSVNGVRPGRCVIKRYLIRKDSGDISNAVIKLNCPYVTRQEETEYLSAISVPAQSMERITTDGSLTLEVNLKPNETALYTMALED